MSKIAMGFVLIDAPYSALNNAGTDAGEKTDNVVKVKVLNRGKANYPYVSGQAWRYWWRNTLTDQFDWKPSPLFREKKIAYTDADPANYIDDDVFGYMRAPKKQTKPKKGKKGETNDEEQEVDKEKKVKKGNDSDLKSLTRPSPLKNSPLISVLRQNPTNDFGVMARHTGDAVPYEHEFYGAVLQGIFSLDLEQVGRFSSYHKTGYQNIPISYGQENNLEILKELPDGKIFQLPFDKRQKRIKDTLNALSILSGGAKLTTHLTDVMPKLVVLAVLTCGNHIFMHLVKEVDRSIEFNFDSLDEIIQEYKGKFIGDIYIGKRKGFLDNIEEKFTDLAQKYGENKESIPKIHYGPINEIINKFAEETSSIEK